MSTVVLGDTIAFLRSQGHHNLARRGASSRIPAAGTTAAIRYGISGRVEPEREPVIALNRRLVAVLATVPRAPQQVTVNNAARQSSRAPQITVNVPEAEAAAGDCEQVAREYKKVIHRDERGLIVEITDELMTP